MYGNGAYFKRETARTSSYYYKNFLTAEGACRRVLYPTKSEKRI